MSYTATPQLSSASLIPMHLSCLKYYVALCFVVVRFFKLSLVAFIFIFSSKLFRYNSITESWIKSGFMFAVFWWKSLSKLGEYHSHGNIIPNGSSSSLTLTLLILLQLGEKLIPFNNSESYTSEMFLLDKLTTFTLTSYHLFYYSKKTVSLTFSFFCESCNSLLLESLLSVCFILLYKQFLWCIKHLMIQVNIAFINPVTASIIKL